nr:hypothetical protein CFP56_62523 [Quercus suber]
MKFDEINLNDDKPAPKIDLDFGLGESKTDTKTSNGFSFGGGWGGGWGSSGADAPKSNTSWGFGAMDEAVKDAPAEDTWGLAGSKKEKKKKAGAFDFSFDDVDRDADLGLSTKPEEKPEEKPIEEDSWGVITTKKEKKKKGKAEPEPVVEPTPPPPETKIEADPWTTPATAKDKKKKKKGSIWDPEPELEPEPVVAVPDPVPSAEEGGKKQEKETEEHDMWSSFGMSEKEKKKAAKKGAKAGFVEEQLPEDPVPTPAPDEVDIWGNLNKDKKKKAGTFDLGFTDESTQNETSTPAEPATDWLGGGWDTGKKTKKGKKGALVEEPAPPPVVTEPEPKSTVEDKKEDEDWFGGWGTTSAKDKKKKKGGKVEPEPSPPPAETAPPAATTTEPSIGDDWMTSSATTKKTKKSKKNALEDETPAPPPITEPEPEPAVVKEADDDDFMSGWGIKKDKKKKGKTEIAALPAATSKEPEALLPAVIDEVKIEPEEDWMGDWTTGTKKKASKKDKSKGVTEIVDPSPGASVLLPESVQEKAADEDVWGTWGNVGKKEKKKGVKSPEPDPPNEKLLEAPPSAEPALVDLAETNNDPWSFASTTTKKGKKDKKGTKVEEIAKSKPQADLDDVTEKTKEAVPEPEQKIEEPKEEKKSKTSSASTGWGSSLWGSSKTTTKTTKEKEKERKEQEAKEKAEKEAADAAEAQRKADEEAAFAEALGDDPDDMLDFTNETAAPSPPPVTKKSSSKDKEKDSKKKSSDKSSKVDAKSSKKAVPVDEPVAAVVEEPAELDFEPTADELADLLDEPKKTDSWGFWGSSLKSSTKKASPAKEISTNALTNQDSELTGREKLPEDDLLTSATLPPKSTSKTKTSVKSTSIADRIKALQGGGEAEVAKSSKKLSSRKAVPPSPPPADPELEPEPEPTIEPEAIVITPPSPEVKKSKDKKSSTSKSSKKEVSSEPIVPAPPPSASPIPGGFPGDEILDLLPQADMPAEPKKSSTKDKKSSSKATKKDAKSSKAEEPVVQSLPASPADLVDVAENEPLPTPPPERSTRNEPQSAKKERPKVVRDQQTASWGFWNAAPTPKSGAKKESRSRDIASPTKERPSELSRSRSERTTAEKDPLEKASKSSGSDKDGKGASKSRPSTSRGASLGAMFGMAPTPSRSRSTKIPSSSRRHSVAVEDSGLMSPPPDDGPEIGSKAAQVMGVSRSKSTRERTKSRKVTDPYAIDDDDDLVMVDPPEDSAKDMPPYETSRDKRSRRSKRQPGMMSGGLAEDETMTDTARPSDEANDFVRPALKRSSTTASKKPGLMGGLFGAAFGSSRPTPERRTSKAYESEDGMSRRKRGSVYEEDAAKRLRRDDRKVRRSRKQSDAEGLTDAAPLTETEDPVREARRAERRARKEREAAEEESRSARRREKDEARRAQAREEEERVAREDEEREERRRIRRAEREQQRAEEDRIAREEEAKASERRERRRERERLRAEEEAAMTRPKAPDRRRSTVDRSADDDEARRVRREERRVRRSVDQSAGMERDAARNSRRRSAYGPPAGDAYYDKRNGEAPTRGAGKTSPPNADGVRPFVKPGGDKTASWVHSINSDPPPPPPLEGTIIDAPVYYAADTTPDTLDETNARELRHKQRRERERADGYSRRRGDGDGVRSSDGSASHDRKRSSYAGGPVNSLGYNEMGGKHWDSRPAMPPKKGSWLKKIAGL